MGVKSAFSSPDWRRAVPNAGSIPAQGFGRNETPFRAFAGPERRILSDRRTEEDRRLNASPEGTRRWVCFKSDGETRRCGFVPANWEQLSERELRILLRAAKPRLRRDSGSSSTAVAGGLEDSY